MLALVTAFLMSVAAAIIKKPTFFIDIEWVLFLQYLVCLLLMLIWFMKERVKALLADYLGSHLFGRRVAGSVWLLCCV